MKNLSKVCIVGLGYVGLPLALAVAQTGKRVLGFDIDESHIENLKSGKSRIEGIALTELINLQSTGQLTVTNQASQISECQIVIIAVPTPLDMNGGVDLSALRLAASLVAKNISPSTLVINESTSFPGTLREVIFPIFQQELSDVSTIHFACSPERVDPGNRDYTFANTPRVVAGLNTESSTLARDFYSLFVDNVEVVDSPEIAELSKLIENSYRLLNISFINELKDFCRKKDIPLMAAIRAASTKPYGFQPFYPSAGAGGHCIPIDPVYLMESAKSLGVEIKTLEAAAHSNRNFPKKVIDVCEEIIGDLQGKVILIEGLAYKADISDVRESAAVALFNELGQRGADVHWRDPMIKSWLIPQTKFEAKEFDLIIVCTIHATSDLNYVTRLDTPVLDLTQRVPKCKNVIPF